MPLINGQYIKPSELDEQREQRERHGIGAFVGGLGSEIGIASVSQLAGAATGWGYIPIAFGGGFAGSIANQRINDEPFSIGRAVAAGLLNLVPGGVGIKAGRQAGKAAQLLKAADRGLNSYNGKTVPNIIFKEAMKGAAFGGSEVTIQKIIDEERLPTSDEFFQYTGLGAGFGGAIGGILGATTARSMGKTVPEATNIFFEEAPRWSKMDLDEKIKTAEHLGFYDPKIDPILPKAKQVNQILEPDLDGEFNKFLKESARSFTQENYIKAWLLSEDPTLEAGKVWLSKIKGWFAPSKILGSEFHNQMGAINGRMTEMESAGASFRNQYHHLIKGKSESEQNEISRNIREYLTRPHEGDPGIVSHSEVYDTVRVKALPKGPIRKGITKGGKLASVIEGYKLKGDLDSWKKLRSEVQQELSPFLEPKAFKTFQKNVDLGELDTLLGMQTLDDTVKESIILQNYLTREYRLLEDESFVAIPADKKDLIDDFVENHPDFQIPGPKVGQPLGMKKGSVRYPKFWTGKFPSWTTGTDGKLLSPKKLEARARDRAEMYIDNHYLSRSANPANRKSIKKFSSARLKDNVDILAKRHYLSPALTKFLGGEIEDIGETVYATGLRIAKLGAKFRAEEFILRDLRSRGLINIRKFTKDDEGPLPSQIEFENPLQTTFLNGEIEIDGPAYVIKELEELKASNFMGNVVDSEISRIDKVLGAIYRPLHGASKATKVIFNPASWSTNLLGAQFAALASGNFNLLGKDALKGVRASFDEFGSMTGPASGWVGRQVSKLGRLGLDDEGIKAMRKDIGTMQRLGLMNADVSVGDTMRSLGAGSIGRKLQSTLEPFSKGYQVTDNAYRYVVWKGNTAKLKKMFSLPEGMDPGKYNDEMERASAFLTNDTYQNYNKISKMIRDLSAKGLMPPFVAFTAELTRNLYNNAKYSAMMVRGKFGKGLGLSDDVLRNVNQGAMVAEGTKRLTILSGLTIGSYVAINYLNEKEGVDREKIDALKNTVIPEYDRTKELIITMNPDGKSGHYINASYINPFAQFNRFARAYQDGTNTIGSLGQMANVIKDEFIGKGNFVFQELGDVVRNTDEYGNPISIKEGQVGRATDLAGHFFTELLRPGAVRELDKWVDALNNVGDNETKDLVQRMLGIRKTSFNLEEDSKWKIRPSKERLTIAEGRYFYMQQQEDVSPQLKEQAYVEANQARLNSMGKLQTVYDSLKVLGMSENDTISIMKKNRVSGSDVIQLSQNNIQNLELSKEESISSEYERLSSETFNETKTNIIRDTEDNPKKRKSLLNKLQKEQLYDRRGVTMFDRQLLGLGVAERADTLMNVLGVKPTDYVLVREYRRKGVITDDVLMAMRLRAKQASY